MQYNILENSMDSLSEAIEYYIKAKDKNNERCYKFCVLMLYHSIELILKEVLIRENEILILENINDYNKTSKFRTIGLNVALYRVKSVCKKNLGIYDTYIEELISLRNDIQHYKIDINIEKAKITIIKAFSTVEYLVINILDSNFNNFGEIINQNKIKILHNDEEAYNNRKQDILKKIKDDKLIRVSFNYLNDKKIEIPCPKCGEKFLIFNNLNGIKCNYCGENFDNIKNLYDNDSENIIANNMERELGKRKHLIEYILVCLDCDYRTLIYNEVDQIWKCAACGSLISDDDVVEHFCNIEMQGRADYEAYVADLMEDPHNSHLW